MLNSLTELPGSCSTARPPPPTTSSLSSSFSLSSCLDLVVPAFHSSCQLPAPTLSQSISTRQLSLNPILGAAALRCTAIIRNSSTGTGRLNGARGVRWRLNGRLPARLSLLAPKHQPHPIRAVHRGPDAQPFSRSVYVFSFLPGQSSTQKRPTCLVPTGPPRGNATALTSPRRPFPVSFRLDFIASGGDTRSCRLII